MYRPQSKTAEVLDRAYQLVQEVPYKVSARWLFYRLLQEGYYKSKDDYRNKFMDAISEARRSFYGEWRPDTLADDTRDTIVRNGIFSDGKDWLQAIADNATCKLDKWLHQEHYVEIWFEARAMSSQFEHYTKHVTLRPMGGQPSIPYKWQAAKELEHAAKLYKKELVVLYFGDLDAAGLTISDTIARDVMAWCEYPFRFIRCGLDYGQVKKYKVPENVEHPDSYQWEALTDKAANQIITSSLKKFIRQDRFSEVEEREQKATNWLRSTIAPLVNGYPE